jgi:2-oxoglutarate dehydrogenase E1 component
MYSKIRGHKTTLELYSERLIAEGLVTAEEIERLKADWRAHLETEFELGQDFRPNKTDWLDGQWKDMKRADADGPRRGDTGVALDQLVKIGTAITRVPADFNAHKTVKRFMDNRLAAIESGEGIDWATGEALAFGSLLVEGHPVRLSGQDSERGTFSQRHSVLNDQMTGDTYTPLNNIEPDTQERYEVINSMLSEEAVLGFEYGYSLAEPQALTLWEAQFGDFANGAQVVVDQFISSGERKWFRMSGLVMLLPHGYEGQGPEHSSARLERYLQLCAEDNMQVANCTTPANYFHILRRQIKRDFRKPLILMTPKSLLRHKRATSTLSEMGPDSCFHRLLWDDAEAPGPRKTTIELAPDDKIRRVVLCSGKVYYDLLEDREKRGINDVYLLRLEQLYPFPAKALLDELNRFKNAEVVWCQEEPRNMGAWAFVQPYVDWVLEQMGRTNDRPRYVGRAASASTATGLMRTHLAQLQAFLEEAFAK